jgi:ABC-type bacteriocin/lantibiotic exporter with double-glycine peptidase domain
MTFHCLAIKDIAIVGANGSGKSTLVKLGKLYNDDKGAITIDSIPVHTINEEFRSKVFFFQDFEKYFLSVGESIKFRFKETINIERLQHVNSGASTFIDK